MQDLNVTYSSLLHMIRCRVFKYTQLDTFHGNPKFTIFSALYYVLFFLDLNFTIFTQNHSYNNMHFFAKIIIEVAMV